jgi:hypothetical protein
MDLFNPLRSEKLRKKINSLRIAPDVLFLKIEIVELKIDIDRVAGIIKLINIVHLFN